MKVEDTNLRGILRCPACGGRLDGGAAEVVCDGCRARFPIREGAVWAGGEAAASGAIDAGAVAGMLHRVVAVPRVYDWVQRVVGTPETAQRLRRHLADTAGKTVLDVGAGTGKARAFVPEDARYVWLDPDPQKLRGFRSKWPGDPALLADATAIPLADKSIDTGISVAMAHHLPDDALARFLGELARVLRDKLVLMDPVRVGGVVPAVLWRYDRGAHPRRPGELVAALEPRFRVESVERYRKLHHYLLCVARPRDG